MNDSYHLLEDGFRMLYEDGSGMLLDFGASPWTEQPAPTGIWTEQSASTGNWTEQPLP